MGKGLANKWNHHLTAPRLLPRHANVGFASQWRRSAGHPCAVGVFRGPVTAAAPSLYRIRAAFQRVGLHTREPIRRQRKCSSLAPTAASVAHERG
ncbi:hypothetical protein PsYK624_089760 [Phanerochaete sordida]|uniref:Uncharacterized protein n=1 Tax=Phanerochaete sordida TaxID=48140 RepID=A0A9P3GEE4_9APHY|nr:hypothetical protein PsYK624_089760 [Phanerochaete sordida]